MDVQGRNVTMKVGPNTETVTRQANQLKREDVIVAPDGSWHEVTDIEHHGLAGAWLTVVTNTGLRLNKTQNEAKLDTYEVIRFAWPLLNEGFDNGEGVLA